MVIKPVTCRMLVGRQQRGPTFREQLDPDDGETCRERARTLARDRGLPADRTVLEIKVNGRWVGHRAA